MRDYLLFVDTETTGIPKNWHAPYTDRENWPCSVQIAWAVYTKAGETVKTENFYVRDDDFNISPESVRIHGITHDFLIKHGVPREQVLTQLTADLNQYQPLVVAHYMQLDYHMIGVGYHRADMHNPLPGLPLFCTMKASSRFPLQHRQRFLRLGELYERLFQRPMGRQHDSLVDATAAADCFFELVKRGDIDEGMIEKQHALDVPDLYPSLKNKAGCGVTALLMFLLTLLFTYAIYG
ncbi:3'-5' exonuclease [Pontibacter russatus]|uniref:3'-5' exonuclease n=1 Tax=Pontibacter russatus TaxID=2694929 RepID=UPI00137A7248|nr:3'-5' exonuclease [Pontibacter russatus]